MAFAQVAWAGLPEAVATTKSYVVIDGAAGLDLRPAKIISFAPVLRVAIHPGLRTNNDAAAGENKYRAEAQIAVQPSIGVTIHI